DAAPGQELCTVQVHGRWRNSASSAFAAKSGDGTRMRQKKSGLFPDPRYQFVEVIGRGRAFAGLDATLRDDVIQQAILGVVDQLIFLAFLYFFDHQPQLFANLVVRAAV